VSELERKLIDRIRESEDPEEFMDYIEDLLFNPQKFREALEKPFALQVS
jgi:hypothetical protein